MPLFPTIAILLTLAAAFAYLNHRFVKLPMTIGVMVLALVASLAVILLGQFGHLADFIQVWGEHLLGGINFERTLLHGLLAYLLFAGALHMNLEDLGAQKWTILLLATVGVALSTVLVAALTFWMLVPLGLRIDFQYCLLFGALISPTDPIAVLGILKTVGAPKSLETKITGESLFNDGVGVVIFLVLLEMAEGTRPVTATHVAQLLAQEALGGAILGLILGYITYQLLKRVDNYQVEVLLTVALATGGYSLADSLHLSGPIAIVVAGLLIGNHGRSFAMSDRTREHLDTFWELIDEILNAVLFLLIGLEVLVMPYTRSSLYAGLIAIAIVLLARWLSVWTLVSALRRARDFSPGVVPLMTWGGLRGAISVALALSLPPRFGAVRQLLLQMTYVIVVFSIIGQGLTLRPLFRKLYQR